MFTHTLERKYMFLICNAILAFLAKSSLLTSSPPISAAFHIEFQASNLSETEEEPISEEAEAVFPLGSFRSHMVEEEFEQVEKQEEHYEQVSEAEEEAQEEEHGILFTETKGRENEEASIAEEEGVEGKDQEDEEGGTGSGVMVIQDEESADTTMATNEELANMDELNRKFEEFIRKMKEEIRIEAQRQPIAV